MSPFVKLHDVRLRFDVRQKKRPSLKSLAMKLFRGRRSPSRRCIRALRGVTLEFAPGERVGILGHNGAGKSSLLRLIGNIYQPTGGRLERQGMTLGLFHAGESLEPSLTGLENIHRLGAIVDLPRKVMRSLEAEILDFADLKESANVRVKKYSRGMATRLAFATVTALSPQILLLDEALDGVDLHFRMKMQQRVTELMQRTDIVLIASHEAETVRTICNRALWMRKGRVVLDGDPHTVAAAYEQDIAEKTNPPPPIVETVEPAKAA